jgi:hypothetical protein
MRDCEAGDASETDRATCRLNCDAAHGAPPTRGPASTGAAPPPAASPDIDPVDRASDCLSRCYTGPSTSAGCATDCKTTAAAAPAAPAADVLDRLDACIRACHSTHAAKLETDRATCELNCGQEARVAGPASP